MLFLLFACTGEPEREPLATRDTAIQIAELGMERWAVEDMPFDWMQTVWAFSIHELGRSTGDSTYSDYSTGWMLDNVAKFEGDDPKAFHSSDSMSPALLASLAMADDDLPLTPITDAAHLYLASAPRTDAGAIEHWADGSPFGEIGQVWVDSQFMFGMFLLGEYDRTGDEAYLDEWVEQYELFSDHCRDPDDQLYRHAWDDWEGVNIPAEATYWNRGNSWVLVSAAEFLNRVDASHPAYDRIAEQFRTHADATIALQAEDGLWWTVLNSSADANYTETSGSALIAYALHRGIEAGVLNDSSHLDAVLAAADAVQAEVTEDGVVEGTSFGTNPGDEAYYLSVTQLDDIILGVGAVVLFLDEVDGL